MSLIPISDFPVLRPDSSIKDALSLFEGSTFSTIFILSPDNKLLGTVTDGDIRRSLLNNSLLDASLDSVMNTDYKSVDISDDIAEAINLSKSLGLSEIPIIDDSHRLHSVYTSKETKRFDIPVIIMAGGKGKRLKPLTNTCPKPMICINDKPMLEIIIKQFLSIGASNFYISVNYLKEQIMDYFGDGSQYNVSINYLEENEPLGTAGSLSLLPKDFNTDFLVMNCDVLSLISFPSLYDFFITRRSDAVMCVRPYNLDLPFGVVKHDGFDFIDIEEKPTLDFMVNTGIYIFSSKVLQCIQGSYLDMPDLFRSAGLIGCATHVYPLHEQWVDVGRHSALREASKTTWF